MTLILHHLPPIHWAVAGAAIAVITLALLFLANRRLGLSTGFEDICSLALPLPYFQRKAVVSGRAWRLPFIIGLLAGGFLSAVLGGGWSPTWQLGMFDERIGFGAAGKLAWMFAGGLFIGFGTRLGNGCTSGHGVCGIGRRSKRSLIATVVFMVTGVATVFLLNQVLGH